MSIKIPDLTFTSVEEIRLRDINYGNLIAILDEMHNITIAQDEESEDIVGKNSKKITSLKRNKTVTISGVSGFVSGGLMELQTGSDFEADVVEGSFVTEILTISANNTATGKYYAAEFTSPNVYLINESDIIFRKLELTTSAPNVGQFSYSVETGKLVITVSAETKGLNEGVNRLYVEYGVPYMGDMHVNMSDTFSQKCMVEICLLAEDKCGKVYKVDIFIPKGDVSGSFSLDIGDGQSTHPFEIEALAGACGSNGELWMWFIHDANAEPYGKEEMPG